ncbi:hypothetical protein PRZ48_005328 [Zasmidium cellare]|uniref:Uncharacterized protein n=1 Tax=Zasmidium cellare TaxID=395010 RepID=A0ABR0ESF0_ZASCE|nr:hypothetical protein PRZ48_005328 [Zasmidium cellare]
MTPLDTAITLIRAALIGRSILTFCFPSLLQTLTDHSYHAALIPPPEQVKNSQLLLLIWIDFIAHFLLIHGLAQIAFFAFGLRILQRHPPAIAQHSLWNLTWARALCAPSFARDELTPRWCLYGLVSRAMLTGLWFWVFGYFYTPSGWLAWFVFFVGVGYLVDNGMLLMERKAVEVQRYLDTLE